ncbi:hypothetical protein BS50DRAFT_335222 [Corynespora cassiicola Philippines]|uniref:LysM domain-containing protein n=1 Tax=Corynespora cassiicola Philippines TaxID=1448308 RepID=A0A2T2NUT2_CORCC|nr:hypothetical protein BS50DRAFT_335222 [Corynespora cassiicola Philippines]
MAIKTMATPSFIMAASSLFALSFGAPIQSLQARDWNYERYSGDGSVAAGWPSQDRWLSFDKLWSLNEPTMRIACSQYGVSENSDGELSAIRAAIEQTANKEQVPSNYVLAVMMQESKGCARVHTTNNGHRNPGLMQSFEGTATCNANEAGKGFDASKVTTPCPDWTITKMIQEGVEANRPQSLKVALQKAGGANDVSKYYRALKIYNSGNVGSGNLVEATSGTRCYVNDVANRLLGWDGESTNYCESGGNGPANVNSQSQGVVQSSAATESQQYQATPIPPSYVPPQKEQPESSGNGLYYPNAAAGCKKWFTVKNGDYCDATGVPLKTLQELNPGLNDKCTNLWRGYNYCISTS